MLTQGSEQLRRFAAELTPREKKVLCKRLAISEAELMQGNFDLQKLSEPIQDVRARLLALEERMRLPDDGPKGKA